MSLEKSPARNVELTRKLGVWDLQRRGGMPTRFQAAVSVGLQRGQARDGHRIFSSRPAAFSSRHKFTICPMCAYGTIVRMDEYKEWSLMCEMEYWEQLEEEREQAKQDAGTAEERCPARE
jgi:hypothetical protein